jgi:uncharacterized membrane protein (UPF0127 family)
MDRKRVKHSVCAFNISRQAFISLHVKLADTSLARLRGLLGKVRMRSDEGLWVVPSQGIHTFGLLFPIDVLYLDASLRVIDLVENLPPLRITGIRWQCASVLQLPTRSIYDSGTQIGDELLIGTPEEMGEYWDSRRPDAGKGARTGPEPAPGPGPPDLSQVL